MLEDIVEDNDIEEIHKDLSEILGTETLDNLNLDILKLKNYISKTLNKIDIYKATMSKDNKSINSFLTMDIQAQKLIKESYIIIYALRDFLTGQEIDYRYYFSNSNGEVEVRHFTLKDILPFMKVNLTQNQNKDYKWVISLSSSVKNLAEDEESLKYKQILNNHWSNLFNATNFASMANGRYRVHKRAVMLKYSKKTAEDTLGQFNALPNLWKKTGRKDGYALFNMGHIFEAFDIAASKGLLSKSDITSASLNRYVFTKSLNNDNIAGVKGGDNPFTNTSIKSNSANLMSLTSVYNNLNIINNILNSKDKKEISDLIKNNFLSKDKIKNKRTLNKIANEGAEKILNILKTN